MPQVGHSAGPGHDAPETTLHASCVAIDRKAVLIIGPSGAGKSSLALQLMALGAGLIADDHTTLRRRGSELWASAPASITGRIEARGVGLLRACSAPTCPVELAVDLSRIESQRLPPRREMTLLGCHIDVIFNAPDIPFFAAILQYIRGGRSA